MLKDVGLFPERCWTDVRKTLFFLKDVGSAKKKGLLVLFEALQSLSEKNSVFRTSVQSLSGNNSVSFNVFQEKLWFSQNFAALCQKPPCSSPASSKKKPKHQRATTRPTRFGWEAQSKNALRKIVSNTAPTMKNEPSFSSANESLAWLIYIRHVAHSLLVAKQKR